MDNTTADAIPLTTPFHPSHRVALPLTIFFAFIGVVGTLGNALIFTALYKLKSLVRTGNMFIVSIAIADFIVTTAIIPIVVADSLSPGQLLDDVSCTVQAVVMFSAICISNFNFMLIALNRYLAICHGNKYQGLFRRPMVVGALTLGPWLFYTLMSCLSLAVFGHTRYLEYAHFCFEDIKKYRVKMMVVTTLAVIVPAAVAMFCYSMIFHTIVKSRAKVQTTTTAGATKNGAAPATLATRLRLSHRTRRELQTVVTMFVTFMAFVFSWLPTISSVFFHLSSRNPIVERFSVWFALSNSSYNAIIYGLLNSKFRAAYAEILCFWRRNRAQASVRAISTVNDRSARDSSVAEAQA